MQSAALLDAEARTEGDDRRRAFIEENAYRFRTAAGVEAPSIDLLDSKKAADVTDATKQTETNALRIQYAQKPELRAQETELRAQGSELSTQVDPPEAAAPAKGGSRLYAMEELTVGTLLDRVSEIGMGLSAESFSGEERSAALAIRSAAERADRGEVVMVLADPHEMLGGVGDVVAQFGEIGRMVAECAIGL